MLSVRHLSPAQTHQVSFGYRPADRRDITNQDTLEVYLKETEDVRKPSFAEEGNFLALLDQITGGIKKAFRNSKNKSAFNPQQIRENAKTIETAVNSIDFVA